MKWILSGCALAFIPVWVNAAPAGLLANLNLNGSSTHQVSGYVNWTSDYAYRGVSLSDKRPAQQANLHYQNESGLFAGWWVSTLDFAPPDGPNTEHNLYVGHSQRWSDRWRSDISATYFNFRGGSIGPDNDFVQWQLATTYADFITARFYYADNSYGLRFSSKAAELAMVYAFNPYWSVAGTAGYWDISHLSDETYFYSDVALRYQINHLSISCSQHWASAGARRTYGDLADSGYVMMIAIGF